MRFLVLPVMLLGLSGCNEDYVAPEWKKTPQGVSYYVTCAEGFKFVATSSTHSKTQLAGPIGECDE